METKMNNEQKREDVVTLPGASDYVENIRQQNEKLGEVLNELVANETLDDPETLQWMAKYVAEARMYLSLLASDMTPSTNSQNC